MKKRSFLFNGLIVISLVISIAGLSYAQSTRNKLTEESTLTQIMKRGSIRVGFSTFIPWAMKDKKGDFIGFEVEVMQQLAKDMGVKLELVPTKWAGIIPALRTGKFDAIICGIRAFNTREGLSRADDTLPERLLTEPLKAGASKGHFISKEELTQMLDEYYAARGWDVKTGAPTREKLSELGLDYVAEQLA